MLGINMKDVSAAGGNRPGPGGYVVRIMRVTNQPDKQRIELEIDIDEGKYNGYYTDLYNRKGFWGATFLKSYKESAFPFFKAFIETIQKCNDDTTGLVVGDWEDIDETKLLGKKFGIVFGHKEYVGNDGKTKERPDWYGADIVTLDKIRSGEYEVPDLIKLEGSAPAAGGVVDTTASFEPLRDDDVPF